MVTGIIGKKVGMTQLFLEDGTLEPATVLQAGPCVVVQGKTAQTDGYDAVQLGFVDGRYKANKPTAGHFKKANVPPTRIRREVGIAKGAEAPAAGAQVLVSIFNQGERVDVIGTSKGHGFQGVMKKHNMSGQNQTHGSMMHRRNGAIGMRSTPGRIWKNMGMPGHMGDERVTVQNLTVVQVREEEGVILVSGAVPGKPGTYVVVRPAKKAKKEAAK